MQIFKQVFTELVRKYTESDIVTKLWNEIVINYNDAGRYYHTFDHLEQMYKQLLDAKNEIEDWDTILFALFYHDIIYITNRTDNEAESANIARDRLTSIEFPEDRIKRCVLHILATKAHAPSMDSDTNLFIDADLSILGTSQDIYIKYTKEIRDEYFIYPDDIYKNGRKKILTHFLNMDRIFKSNFFFNKYEEIARGNLSEELSLQK